MAKVDQTKANALLRAARTMSLGQIKIQYEFCTVIMLLKISILSWCKNKTQKRYPGLEQTHR